MSISQAIKRVRTSLFLEQQEFAKQIGVTKSAVSNYEKGTRTPRIPTIRKIMEVAKKHKIKINPEDFLEQ